MFLEIIHWNRVEHFDWLWFSVTYSVAKRSFLDKGTPICECKDRYLECSQGLYWFSRLVVGGSPFKIHDRKKKAAEMAQWLEY